MNYETALAELEKIVGKLETGQLPLEDALANFEIGIKLARECQQSLQIVEQRVQLLTEQNGELKTTPFDAIDTE